MCKDKYVPDDSLRICTILNFYLHYDTMLSHLWLRWMNISLSSFGCRPNISISSSFFGTLNDYCTVFTCFKIFSILSISRAKTSIMLFTNGLPNSGNWCSGQNMKCLPRTKTKTSEQQRGGLRWLKSYTCVYIHVPYIHIHKVVWRRCNYLFLLIVYCLLLLLFFIIFYCFF